VRLGAEQRLRGSARASVRPGEAQREQGLSQCSLLTHIMSDRKRKASSSEEPGESTASLCTAPDAGQGALGLCLRLEMRGEEGAGRSSQAGMGLGPSAPWQGGPAWAVAALGLPWPLPLHHLQPARQAQSRTLGTALRDVWSRQLLTAARICSLLCSVCAVWPGRCRSERLRTHIFCEWDSRP